MIHLLCRNRVKDFAKWHAVFVSHAAAHQEAGLRLLHIWRGVDEPDNIFFLFDVVSKDQAKAFVKDSKAAKAGKASGVIDGEYHFLENASGY